MATNEDAQMIEKKAINKYDKTLQTIVVIEEVSELIKGLSKNLRGKDNHDSIVEEIAVVYIMLEQVMIMNNIQLHEVVDKMSEKLERLRERMYADDSR